MPKKTKPATADRVAAAEAAARRAAAEAAAAEYPEHLLTVEQALAFAGALVDAVHRHVTDKTVLHAVAADLNDILKKHPRRDAGFD